jgi:hypothetical protein
MTKELLWVGALLLLLWCYHGERNQPQANASPAEKPSAAVAQAADPETPGSTGQRRPSALSEPQAYDQPAPQKAKRASSTPAAKSAFHAKTEPRPFQFSLPAPTGDLAGLAARRDLPPPPVLLHPVLGPAPNLGNRPRLCEVSTATYEPAKPGRFRKLAQNVPGLRGSQKFAGSKGFVPARPLHDITFLLPQGSSPGIMATKRMDLKATVDSSGGVVRVELMSPLEEDLVTLASYAASAWRFTPAQSNEKPVASEVILHFNFGAN